jgi:hypothetical protein
MFRSMLPFTTLPGLTPIPLATISPVNVVNLVLIKIVLVVYIDVPAVVPVAVAPSAASPGTEGKSSRAPRQPHAGIVTRIGIRIIWISCRRGPVDHRLIVRRDVDYVGCSRLYDDDLFATFNRLGLHCLLRARF